MFKEERLRDTAKLLVVRRAMVRNPWQNNPTGYKIVSQRDNERHYQQQQFIVYHKKKGKEKERKEKRSACACAVQ